MALIMTEGVQGFAMAEVIYLTGAPASGKSTLTKALRAHVADAAAGSL
jgi:adenylylsulfate kinase-like enzyme